MDAILDLSRQFFEQLPPDAQNLAPYALAASVLVGILTFVVLSQVDPPV